MSDLTDIQAAASVKIVGSASDGTEGVPVPSDSLGNLQVTVIQNELVSINNSSTANLAASATFNGTSDSIKGYGSVCINFFATQACTIQVFQSTDNTNWDFVDSYSVAASTGDKRVYRALGLYVKVSVTNNGAIATTSLRLQTILSPMPSEEYSLGQKLMAQSVPVTMASDQPPMLVSPAPPSDRQSTGTIVALNGTVQIVCQGVASIIINLAGTWVAKIVFEGSIDGTTWFNATTLALSTNSQVLSATANGLYQVPSAGYLYVRVRASSFTSGTVNVNMEGNQGNFSVFAISASAGFNSKFSFGDVTTAASTTVPVRRTAYTEQTSNAQRSIASASANDTAAGTGARQVAIIYYTSTGDGPFSEIVTLNGTAYVNTVNTNICYVEDIQVVSVGSGGVNTGIITLKAAITGGGATIGTIGATDNQTFWSHHYIANGIVAHFTGISCGHNGTTVGSGALFNMTAKKLNVVTDPELQVSDFVRLYGQSSTFSRVYQSAITVIGPARVTIYVTPETTSSVVYRAAFDFFE